MPTAKLALRDCPLPNRLHVLRLLLFLEIFIAYLLLSSSNFASMFLLDRTFCAILQVRGFSCQLPLQCQRAIWTAPTAPPTLPSRSSDHLLGLLFSTLKYVGWSQLLSSFCQSVVFFNKDQSSFSHLFKYIFCRFCWRSDNLRSVSVVFCLDILLRQVFSLLYRLESNLLFRLAQFFHSVKFAGSIFFFFCLNN